MKGDQLNLRDLRAFGVMMRERNLTRTAANLSTTQPTVSKILARLRAHCNDPLFIRAGAHMQPTAKALQLNQTVHELLAKSEELRGNLEPFDPTVSRRVFRLLLTDVGMINFLPPILRYLHREASGIGLLAVPMDSRQLEVKLESGEADIAIGAFSRANRSLRQQRLNSDIYVSVAKKSHPRLAQLRTRASFLAERHVLVTASTSGHAVHELAARTLEKQIPQDNICLRVPSFIAAAAVIMQTEAVATMTSKLATTLTTNMGLAVFPTPLAMPPVEIGQFWHERYQRDPGHRWMRAVIASIFRKGKGHQP